MFTNTLLKPDLFKIVRIVRINPSFGKVHMESLLGKLLKMALYPHYPHFRPRPLIGGAGIAGIPCSKAGHWRFICGASQHAA